MICPDCGDSINMDIGPEKLLPGGFASRCGTKITFTVDSRLSTEQERIRELEERSKRDGKVTGDS